MNGELRLRGVSRRFGSAVIGLDQVDLDVAGGELVCVIGPSGSGKTTLLRCIAGLEAPDAGSIEVDGRPSGPQCASLVFQGDTLFPELTVTENVAFGLRARRSPARTTAEAIEITLLRLGLTGLEDRYPDELSGGQQRRVALARTLVLRPSVLLLDEPLAGLDHQMAQQTLTLLRSTQRRLGLTTVLVTHDQEIALSSADRLVVMNQGRILQSGPPREVFEQPSDAFVAQFLGRAAFLPVEVLDPLPDGRALVAIFGREQSLPAHPDVVPGPGVAVIRPHALTVSATDQRSGPWAEATGELALIQEVRYYGDHVEYALETEHGSALATGDLDAAIEPQRTVRLRLDRAHTWVLPQAGRA